MRPRRPALAAALAALLLAAGAGAQGYQVALLRFEAEGRSAPQALAREAGLAEGARYPNRAALDAAVAEAERRLRNLRPLESAAVEARELGSSPDGDILVEISVRTADSWNFIALPYAKFDSNSGLLLSVRARDYNFLGGLKELSLDLNREGQDALSGGPAWGAALELGYPFTAAGLSLTAELKAGLTLPEGPWPARAALDAGLRADFPAQGGRYELSLRQGLAYGALDGLGEPYDDRAYLSTRLEAGRRWESGELYLKHALAALGSYYPGGLSDPRLAGGAGLAAALEAGAGRTDWVGNFRSGARLYGRAELAYYPAAGRSAATSRAEAAAFAAAGAFGLSARILALFAPGEPGLEAGRALRGILDAQAPASAALVANLDAAALVLKLRPERLLKKDWARYLGLDLQLGAFIDAGLIDLGPSPRLSAGLQALVFPVASRSLTVRASLGVSVPEALASHGEKPVTELFLGLGLPY